MRVVVIASGELRRYLLDGQPERAVELASGATLADLADVLGAQPEDALLARRGRDILRDHSTLVDGDRVELFAPVGGG
jgi:sulfur carrier protein ThiS